MKKAALLFTTQIILLTSCGGKTPDNSEKENTQKIENADTTIIGTISKLTWDSQISEGEIHLTPSSNPLILCFYLKSGNVFLNDEAKDILTWKSKYEINEKYLNKKVKVTYYKDHNRSQLDQNKHQIKEIHLIDEAASEPNNSPVEYIGIITNLTHGDSTCIIVQEGFDIPNIMSLRLYIDKENHYKVETNKPDFFTQKNYSLQLNPKYVGKKVKVTCELKRMKNSLSYNNYTDPRIPNRVEILNSYVVTNIEVK